MHRMPVGYAVLVLALGTGAAVGADQNVQIITPVAVSTTPVTVPSVAVSTYPIQQPVAVATAPVVPGTQVYVPAAVPVDANRSQDIVAWSKLDGTVQSVDRTNRLMTVQDAEGKNVRVALNDRIRIYRGGQPVAYSDISPNDHVVLRYNEASKNAY